MSDGTEFTGNSPTGDIQDALNQAIFTAMGTLETETIEWSLLKVSGQTATSGNRSRTVVSISAKKAG